MFCAQGRVTSVLVVLLCLLACGCARRVAPRATTRQWVAGRPEPAFDPGGPPDELRGALERLLARGLVAERADGSLAPDAAAGWEWSADSLALTFHLRPGLAFTSGAPCRSNAFRAALEGGLGRTDHATQAWRLAAVVGVDRVRAGRPLPALGIETPDESTLVLRLARRDPGLPAKLAQPGASAPWSGGLAGWSSSAGLGPYRVIEEEPGRALTLLRAGRAPGDTAGGGLADTLRVRFQPNPARVLAYLRARGADLVWPLPGGLDVAMAPAGFRLAVGVARPRRTLVLVMRADLPPTTRAATRHALAEAVNRDRVLVVLGSRATRMGEWLPGAGPFPEPPLDEARVRDWMERAKVGHAFHVFLAYDADGPEAPVARALQGQWSRQGIYAELRPLRGAALARERLEGAAHLALVVAQALPAEAAGPLAGLVMPLRGPAVGSFRTGWRTREFDAWLAPGAAPAGPVSAVQARLAEELVALPLASLPWAWLERPGDGAVRLHPRFGPECATSSRVETSGANPDNPR
jgi:ABC-type transport system substrate-binding protein